MVDDNCLIDAKGDTNRGITIGSRVFIGRNTILSCKNGDIDLDDGANIGFNCEIFSASTVRVGRDTLVAAYCYLIGGDHDFADPSQPVLAQARRSAGVSVGAGAWLGAGAKILDGVTIGDRAIVGAAALVREAVPAGAIAAGIPAKIVGQREEPPGQVAPVKLNVLQVCDHLGWEGSRMHGVKRLFAWMIPRFDPERYNVSLVSLRKKDLSEETLESFGVDITYLQKSKFDPSTLPALLEVIDRKRIDILHLHGYGATTFGRLAGAMRRLPTIVHEHANLTDTPWFQKVADAALEPATDIAIAVSQSTADFVIKARRIPAAKVKVVYLGVPLEEFSRRAPGRARSARRGRSSGSRRMTLRSAR